jgi:hypothetical protein
MLLGDKIKCIKDLFKGSYAGFVKSINTLPELIQRLAFDHKKREKKQSRKQIENGDSSSKQPLPALCPHFARTLPALCPH